MRFTNLQVARIVAASLVLVFHAAYYGQYALGVPNPLGSPAAAYTFRTTIVVLFALSGFVLAHALQRAHLGAYFGFRLLRLFPTFWAALALVLLLRWATATEHPVTAKGLLRLAVLWPEGRKQTSVLHVEWTLFYECFLSLVLIPLAATGRRRGLRVGVSVWLGLCVLRQLVFPVAEPIWHARWVDLPLSIVNVPFLVGVLVYFSRDWLAERRRAVLTGGVVALVLGGVAVPVASPWSYVLQGVGAALAVGFWATGRQVEADRLRVRAGDWAYGVYLLHAPLLVVLFTLAARHGWLPPTGWGGRAGGGAGAGRECRVRGGRVVVLPAAAGVVYRPAACGGEAAVARRGVTATSSPARG